MIYKTLEFLRLNLNNYIKSALNSTTAGTFIYLGNIADFKDDSATDGIDESDALVMTLVNMQEEMTFKNQPAVRKLEPKPQYANPPLMMNLFILFCANQKNYNDGLKMLSHVISYFQQNNHFTYSENPVDFVQLGDQEKAKTKIIMELHSLTFEQINHLWGTLGGKQVPFVLYKARLIEIDAAVRKSGGKYITQIDTVYQ